MSWPTVKLGDVVELQAGIGFPPSLQGRTHGEFPFAKVGDISSVARAGLGDLRGARNYVSREDIASLRARIVPVGSTLFAKIGEAISQNFRVLSGVACLIDNNAMAAIPQVRIDSRFLYRFLQTVDMYAIASSTAVPSLRKTDLALIPVPLPPLPEQRRIASILDQADRLRTSRQKSMADLGIAIESCFTRHFGDPLETSLSAEAVALDSIVEAIIDCPHSTPVWSATGVVCLRTPNLGKGEWNFDETKYVTAATHEDRIRRASLVPGDIILSREGTVGVAAIVPNDFTASMGQRLVQIRPVQSIATSEFVLGYLLDALKPERLEHLLVGSTVRHLNVKDLRALRIKVPARAGGSAALIGDSF